MLLALLALFSLTLLPLSADATASDNYLEWRQYEEEWNESPAWSGGYSSFLRNSGCWVTSISILLRQYGLVSSSVDEFNPWICCGILAEHDALLGSGDMVLSRVGDAFPGFSYAGGVDYSVETLREKLHEHYACAVLVNHGGHMVAVRGVLEDDTVVIADPASDATTLDQFGGSETEILCFGPLQ